MNSNPTSPTTQARKILAERGALVMSNTYDEDEDGDVDALWGEVVLSDNDDNDVEEEDQLMLRGEEEEEFLLQRWMRDNKTHPRDFSPQQSPLHPPPLPPPMNASPTETRSKNHLDALFVEDKPWRNQNHRSTQTQQKLPQHRGSLIGYIRNKLPGKDYTETVPGTSNQTTKGDEALVAAASAADTTIEDENWIHHQNQDLVVEAVSQPSSDGSSFGENESNSQNDFWDDLLPDQSGEEEDSNYFSWEKAVDWPSVSEHQLPIHFCRSMISNQNNRELSSVVSSDQTTWFSPLRASHFVWQHGMLIHSALQLLIERDHLGVEDSMDASDNIWKKGPLKKWSTGKGPSKWKVKYVEIRRGNLCYYEDSGLESGRKSIHLRSTDTVQMPPQEKSSKVTTSSPTYVFEIVQSGSPKKFVWMAKSEEDRQTWMRAIEAAMIGNADDTELDLVEEDHQDDITRYTGTQSRLIAFDLHENYEEAVEELVAEGALRIPVSWIRQQVQDLGGKRKIDERAALGNAVDPQKQIRASIFEFWTSMQKTAFAVNGFVIPQTVPFYSERIFGSLTRCIMEFDNAFMQESDVEQDSSGMGISELQAVSYTRDILVSVLKTREQQDVLYAVNDLLRNDDLIVLSAAKEEKEICHLEVSFAGDERYGATYDRDTVDCEMTVWLRTRRKGSPTSSWRKRFMELSGVVLSYYESASPRPRGLKGQLVLDETSTVTCVENNNSDKEEAERKTEGERRTLVVTTKVETRYLLFESDKIMVEWKDALRNAIDSFAEKNYDNDLEATAQSDTDLKQRHKFRVPGSRAIKGGGKKVFQLARSLRQPGSETGGGTSSQFEEPSTLSATPLLPKRPSMRVLMSPYFPQRGGAGKREPTVQCVAQHLHRYIIKDRFDTSKVLFTVDAKLLQAFMLSGGTNGCLSRGKALVEIDVTGKEQQRLFGEAGKDFERTMMFI